MALMLFVTGICALLAIIVSTGGQVFAAEFPMKPVRLIVPFGPGGSADIVARLVSAEASRRLPQPVVVENRPGADGNIAADQIAKSAPDGYNLLLGTSTLAIVRTLTPNLPYNLQSDLAPPSVAESGYPGYEAGYWNGIFAAAKTPVDIIDRLYGVFADSARTPQVTQKLEALAFEVEAGTPQRFAARIASDVNKWAEVIRKAKIVAP